MAYTKYETNPALNVNPPPNGAPEGMVPSTVNDTIRDVMAEIRLLGDSIDDGTLPGATTPVPVTGGGTGGATQATARTGLDVYSKGEVDSGFLANPPPKVLASGTGPTDALPGEDVPFSFVSRPLLGMYTPLAGILAFSAGDHSKRMALSQTVFDVGVPINVVEAADKETSRVNQSLYSRNQVETLIANLEPIGTIKMWTGLVVDIPAGFALCDGTGGTIDMVNKFVRGTDEAGLGTAGGNDAQTVAFSNVTGGDHAHTGNVNAHILDVTQIPAHAHTEIFNTTLSQHTSGTNQGNILMSNPGSQNTGNTGGGLGHQHGVPTEAHGHTGTQVLDNQPAFYQLMFIQKTSIVLVPV